MSFRERSANESVRRRSTIEVAGISGLGEVGIRDKMQITAPSRKGDKVLKLFEPTVAALIAESLRTIAIFTNTKGERAAEAIAVFAEEPIIARVVAEGLENLAVNYGISVKTPRRDVVLSSDGVHGKYIATWGAIEKSQMHIANASDLLQYKAEEIISTVNFFNEDPLFKKIVAKHLVETALSTFNAELASERLTKAIAVVEADSSAILSDFRAAALKTSKR
jgi:hypothetical protein